MQRITTNDTIPMVTTRVTRRQSKELAKLHEVDSPNESSQTDEDNGPISTNTIDVLITDEALKPKNVSTTKGPSRRKIKKSDPTQCLEIISPMYAIFYEQEVRKK